MLIQKGLAGRVNTYGGDFLVRIFHFGINITIIAILWHNLKKDFPL